MIEVINKLKQTKDNPTNKDLCDILDNMGFSETVRSDIGHYVIERAFVES